MVKLNITYNLKKLMLFRGIVENKTYLCDFQNNITDQQIKEYLENFALEYTKYKFEYNNNYIFKTQLYKNNDNQIIIQIDIENKNIMLINNRDEIREKLNYYGQIPQIQLNINNEKYTTQYVYNEFINEIIFNLEKYSMNKLAITKYTGDEFKYINNALRESDYTDKKYVQLICEIIHCIKKINCFKITNNWIFRRSTMENNFENSIKIGYTFYNKSFVSASLKMDFNDKDDIWFIKLDNNSIRYCGDISCFSMLPKEEEFLFLPYTQFKIIGIINGQNNIYFIECVKNVIMDTHLNFETTNYKNSKSYIRESKDDLDIRSKIMRNISQNTIKNNQNEMLIFSIEESIKSIEKQLTTLKNNIELLKNNKKQ